MYVGATADFTPETALATYQYAVYEGGHTLMLTADELAALWAKTSGKYLYVRFATNAATTVTPDIWYPSECAKKWNNLPQGNLSIKRIAYERVYYKIVYSEWKGGDITIKDTKGSVVDVYVEDTCGFETSDTHLYNGNIKRRGTLTIPAATVNTWAEYVDDEGNLYFLFNPSSNTTITVSSTAPEEQDPEPPLPSATIHAACISESNANIQISVSAAQQLTITNTIGMVVQQWNATTAEPQKIMLNAGTYTLMGANEQITIVL
jgi:hypothetical protein